MPLTPTRTINNVKLGNAVAANHFDEFTDLDVQAAQQLGPSSKDLGSYVDSYNSS